MRLAKVLKESTFSNCNGINKQYRFKKATIYQKLETAGSGFINFYLDKNYLANVRFLKFFLVEKENFGNTISVTMKKVLLEFVSANPTGYLHIRSTAVELLW